MWYEPDELCVAIVSRHSVLQSSATEIGNYLGKPTALSQIRPPKGKLKVREGYLPNPCMRGLGTEKGELDPDGNEIDWSTHIVFSARAHSSGKTEYNEENDEHFHHLAVTQRFRFAARGQTQHIPIQSVDRNAS